MQQVSLLDDYGTHLEVRSISVNAEWYFVVGVCHKDIHSQYGFHDFKDLSISGVQQMVFLPDSSGSSFIKCPV